MMNDKILQVLTKETVGNLEKAIIPLLSMMNPLISKTNGDLEHIRKEVEISYFKFIQDMNFENELNFAEAMNKAHDELTSIMNLKDKQKIADKILMNKGIGKQFEILAGAYYSTSGKYRVLVEMRIKEFYTKIQVLIHEYYRDGIINKFETLKNSCASYSESYEEIKEMIDSIESLEDKEVVQEYIKDTIKNEKIFNYKDMNDYLINNGFKEVRQKGSHRIFSNGKVSIPVPQHKIGKSLSYEIQKQVKVNI